MPYVTIKETKQPQTFKRTSYTKLQNGVPVRLRLLDSDPRVMDRHYVPHAKMSVNCLGWETCPICQSNRKLIADNPNTKPVTNIPGFLSRSTRYVTNVLNRTVVKVMDDGEVVYKVGAAYPPVSANGKSTASVEEGPLNRVEILERSRELFEEINYVHDKNVDEAGNPIGVLNYDLILTPIDQKRGKVRVEADLGSVGVVEFSTEDLTPLESYGLDLTAEEINQLLRGVSVRDIFASREVNEIVTGSNEVHTSDEQIKELFKD